MNVVILVVAIVILLIAVVLFLRKPVNGVSEAELLRLRDENNRVQIALAKAEERASGLILERDKADKLLQDERIRYDGAVTILNQELNTEKNRMAKAEE